MVDDTVFRNRAICTLSPITKKLDTSVADNELVRIGAESRLGRLPDVSVLEEDNQVFYEFRFSNGFRVVTDVLEEEVPFSEEKMRVEYLRVKRLLVDFSKGEVDLLDNDIMGEYDHYISFRISSVGSHFNRQAIVVDDQGEEISRHRPSIIIYTPLNSDRTDYDGEEMLYHWLHELGHAIDLSDFTRRFRLNTQSGQYERIDNDLRDDVKNERDAHAIGVRLIRGIRSRYGYHPSFSEQRFVYDVVQPALHSRHGKARCFTTAYSDADRALFRSEHLEMKRRGLTDPEDQKAFRNLYRREMNINSLGQRLNDKAGEQYDILVGNWLNENLAKAKALNTLFAEGGFETAKTDTELRDELIYNYHTAVFLQDDIPWEQYSQIM